MFALSIARSLEKFGRRSASQLARAAVPLALLFSVLFSVLIAAGCTSAPPAPVAGRDPSSPGTASAPVAYRGVVGPYQSQRPTDPAPWREQNERVAPQEKQ